MNNHGDLEMGRFYVEIEVVNNVDLIESQHGHLKPAEIRRKMIRALVDPGATRLVLPEALVRESGYPSRRPRQKCVTRTDGERCALKLIRFALNYSAATAFSLRSGNRNGTRH